MVTPNKRISESIFGVSVNTYIKHYSCDNGHVYHTNEKSHIKVGLHEKADEYDIISLIHEYYYQNRSFEDKIEKLHNKVREKTAREYELTQSNYCKYGICPLCSQDMNGHTISDEDSIYYCENGHSWHYVYERDSDNKLIPTGRYKFGDPLSSQIKTGIREAELKLITPHVMRKLSRGYIPSINDLFP